MTLKISIVSRGHMIVQVGQKELLISGELTFNPPVFYANLDSIKNWETPYQDTPISEEEKNGIIAAIIQESKNSGTKVLFD